MKGRDVVADIGLFITLVNLAGLFVARIESVPAAVTTSQYFLTLFVHMWFSIYLGNFKGWRKVTWLLLMVSAIGPAFGGFLGYVLPWGQMAYWLAATVPDIPVIGEALVRGIGALLQAAPRIPDYLALFFLLLPFFALVADIAVMHWQRWRHAIVSLFALPVGAIAAAFAIGRLLSLWLPPSWLYVPDRNVFPIFPEWYFLPYFAILRAMAAMLTAVLATSAAKLTGVIAMFVAMVIPSVLPWAKTNEFRLQHRSTWFVLCLGLAVIWGGLGYLGSLPPEGLALTTTQILTLLYFGFFLVLQFVLRRFSNRTSDSAQAASVFN